MMLQLLNRLQHVRRGRTVYKFACETQHSTSGERQEASYRQGLSTSQNELQLYPYLSQDMKLSDKKTFAQLDVLLAVTGVWNRPLGSGA